MCDLFHFKRHIFVLFTVLQTLRFTWISYFLLLLVLTACGVKDPRNNTLLSKANNEISVATTNGQPTDGRRSAAQKNSAKLKSMTSINRGHLAPTLRAANWAFRFPQSKVGLDTQADDLNKTHVPVAVILPLTGRYQGWGRAIQIAFEKSAHIAPHIIWHFLDSRSDLSFAVAETERAIHQLKAQALIGPLSPWSSAAVSARARWYEIPWFALGSFTPLMRHPFSFSWRLEAQDVASSLSHVICECQPTLVNIITDQRPRSQLTAQRLITLLKRCGVSQAKGQIIKGNLQALLRSTLHQTHDLRSTQFGSQYINGLHERNDSTLVFLARGALLKRIFQLLEDQLKTLPIHAQQNAQKLRVFTGLGADFDQTRELPRYIRSITTINRPPLSELGQRYLDHDPESSTLTLEIFDLALWLEKSVEHAHRWHVTLSKALNSVREINGVWGHRTIKQGRLTPTPLTLVTLPP